MPQLRLCFVLLLGLLLACYPEPSFPELEAQPDQNTGTQSSPLASIPVTASGADKPAQGKRRAEVEKQLERLGASAGLPRQKRPGAESWRPAELEKLAEIVSSCCEASDVACRDCLGPLCLGELAPDELWKIYGAFLGPLRMRAYAGVEVLGHHLLRHPDGLTRDRALRIASGAGVLPRGDELEGGFRITTLPRPPRTGDSVLLILERSAACTEVSGEVKGPDEAGRLDVDLRSNCPELPQDESDQFVPKASRYVFTHHVEAMPSSGLELWLSGAKSAVFQLAPSNTQVRPD